MAKSKKPTDATTPGDKPKRKRKSPPPAAGRVPPVDPSLPPPYAGPAAAAPLTEDERRYVDEYLVDRNRTLAYQRANPGVDYRGARDAAAALHARPHVYAELQSALRAQSVRTNVRADLVLKEIARVATSDVYDLFDPQTNLLRHPRHVPLDTRKAIASVKVCRERRSVVTQGQTRTVVTESVVEYRLWDKNQALSKLANYLGLQTALPPIDAMLAAFPPKVADQIRAAMLAHAVEPKQITAAITAQQAPQSATYPEDSK